MFSEQAPQLLHASRGDPSSSSRPTRIPPRFRGVRSSPPPNNNIGVAEFDGGSGASLGARGTSSSSSPQPPAVRSAVSDTAIDGFGNNGKPALQERLQAAPIFLREKAIDLREDARDRVLDIRVRSAVLVASEFCVVVSLCSSRC